MAVTKVSSTQTKNEGLPQILRARVNNGTGARSTTASATPAALALVGDTSYTAPTDTDVDIIFSMQHMSMNTSGVTRFWLTIDGTIQNPGTYNNVTPWATATIVHKIQVSAGTTIAIGIKWAQEGGGTGTTTNATGDTSFPNELTGLVIPRPS